MPDFDNNIIKTKKYDDYLQANGQMLIGQASTVDSGPISGFADAGGGQVTVSDVGHGLQNGDTIIITGTTNYNGTYVVSNRANNDFEITATWVVDDGTGTWANKATGFAGQTCTAGSSGDADAIFDRWRTMNLSDGARDACTINFCLSGLYVPNTDLTLVLGWTTDTSTSGNAYLNVGTQIVAEGAVYTDGLATTYKGYAAVAGPTATKENITTEFTFSGLGAGHHDEIAFIIIRDAISATDTLSDSFKIVRYAIKYKKEYKIIMRLIRYKQPLMVERDSKVNPNYAFVSTVNTENEIDITGFDTLYTFGELSGRDFLFVREQVAVLMTTGGGFAALSAEHKNICATFSVITKAEAATIISPQERSNYNRNVVGRLKQSRETRIELARQVIGDKILDGDISYVDANDLLASTDTLFENFTKGANPEFIDWLNSTGAHTADGFASKTYYTVALQDELLAIVVNGDI